MLTSLCIAVLVCYVITCGLMLSHIYQINKHLELMTNMMKTQSLVITHIDKDFNQRLQVAEMRLSGEDIDPLNPSTECVTDPFINADKCECGHILTQVDIDGGRCTSCMDMLTAIHPSTECVCGQSCDECVCKPIEHVDAEGETGMDKLHAEAVLLQGKINHAMQS